MSKQILKLPLRYRSPRQIVIQAATLYWQLPENYFDKFLFDDRVFHCRFVIVATVIRKLYCVSVSDILSMFNITVDQANQFSVSSIAQSLVDRSQNKAFNHIIDICKMIDIKCLLLEVDIQDHGMKISTKME